MNLSELDFIPCPFCEKRPTIVILDDEGNIHDAEYEDNPWSGLRYGIQHLSKECLIGQHDDEEHFHWSWDSREAAILDWNGRILKRKMRNCDRPFKTLSEFQRCYIEFGSKNGLGYIVDGVVTKPTWKSSFEEWMISPIEDDGEEKSDQHD